jgi:hypothetical protein
MDVFALRDKVVSELQTRMQSEGAWPHSGF